jgi:hypothetical protein
MKTLIALAFAAATLTAANAQTTIQNIPMGGGWTTHMGTAPNGQTITGTTFPLGGGWTSTTLQSGNQTTHCTTMPMGGGWTSTNCY